MGQDIPLGKESEMDNARVVDALTVLLEIIVDLQSNHKKTLNVILDDIDLSDEALEQTIKDAESLIKESVF